MKDLKTLTEQYKMIPIFDPNFDTYINKIILMKEITSICDIQGKHITDSKLKTALKAKEDNFIKILYDITSDKSFKIDMLYDIISNLSSTKLSEEYINVILETCSISKVDEFEKCIMLYYLLHNSAKIEASVAFLAMNLMLKSKGYLPIIIEKDLEESKNVLLCNKGFSPLVEFMRTSAIKLYDTCIEIKVKHSSKNANYDEVFSDFDNIIKTESHKDSYYLTKDLVGTEEFLYKNAGPITDKQQIILSFIREKLGINFTGSNSKQAYYFIKEHYYKAKNSNNESKKGKMEVF